MNGETMEKDRTFNGDIINIAYIYCKLTAIIVKGNPLLEGVS
jgi:hypothetical protein